MQKSTTVLVLTPIPNPHYIMLLKVYYSILIWINRHKNEKIPKCEKRCDRADLYRVVLMGAVRAVRDNSSSFTRYEKKREKWRGGGKKKKKIKVKIKMAASDERCTEFSKIQ